MIEKIFTLKQTHHTHTHTKTYITFPLENQSQYRLTQYLFLSPKLQQTKGNKNEIATAATSWRSSSTTNNLFNNSIGNFLQEDKGNWFGIIYMPTFPRFHLTNQNCNFLCKLPEYPFQLNQNFKRLKFYGDRVKKNIFS